MTCMEDYECKVIKLHATQSRNISKFTGDISRNTSKSTSETNQIKVSGEPLPDCIVAPRNMRPGDSAAPRNTRNLWDLWDYGDYHEAYETIETYGDLRREIKRLPLYDFRILSRLSWENSILDVRVSIHHGYFITRVHAFFSDDVLQGNYFIERVRILQIQWSITITPWKIMNMKWAIHMQLYSRIVVNLPVNVPEY